MNKNDLLYLFTVVGLGMTACSPIHRLQQHEKSLLQDQAVANAHIGISLYDVDQQKYIYDHQGDHYFTPASNTKLFSCYAAMKYLGDSITGLRYFETPDTLYLLPTGDPTLLYRDYETHPVLQFLEQHRKPVSVSSAGWRENRWGKGWSWDDYMEDYMAERSPMPVYGNIANTTIRPDGNSTAGFRFYQIPDITGQVTWLPDSSATRWTVKRAAETNSFTVRYPSSGKAWQATIPFTTGGLETTARLLGSGQWTITPQQPAMPPDAYHAIKSQPLDSMLKPMMYRSDNFYAEQALLMVSQAVLGYMNTAAIIDTILKTDLRDLPQKPYWADGSGLSRFNLFSPQDVVLLLLKMKNEFGLDRVRHILPKGNQGTLTGRYQQIGDDIFGKTGTLTGQVAFSGYLVCKSKKMLLFSVLVNNHNSSAAAVRTAVERYLQAVWEKY